MRSFHKRQQRKLFDVVDEPNAQLGVVAAAAAAAVVLFCPVTSLAAMQFDFCGSLQSWLSWESG